MPILPFIEALNVDIIDWPCSLSLQLQIALLALTINVNRTIALLSNPKTNHHHSPPPDIVLQWWACYQSSTTSWSEMVTWGFDWIDYPDRQLMDNPSTVQCPWFYYDECVGRESDRGLLLRAFAYPSPHSPWHSFSTFSFTHSPPFPLHILHLLFDIPSLHSPWHSFFSEDSLAFIPPYAKSHHWYAAPIIYIYPTLRFIHRAFTYPPPSTWHSFLILVIPPLILFLLASLWSDALGATVYRITHPIPSIRR